MLSTAGRRPRMSEEAFVRFCAGLSWQLPDGVHRDRVIRVVYFVKSRMIQVKW